MKIAPSILSADFTNLSDDIKRIEESGVEYIHIDMMDGQFVPNLSFGPMIMEQIRPLTNLTFDAHLMIEQPERYIDMVAKAGADIITVHAESTQHIHRTLQQISQYDKKVGIAINPGTSVETVKPVLDFVDLVLVMTVNPGFGGQSFIESTLSKIKQLDYWRQECQMDYVIEVDGGINHETGALCLEAGADILVAGSYLFGAHDFNQAVNQLRQCGNE